MNATAITSTSNRCRTRQASAWLESRAQSEEVVIVGATLDAANELVRQVAQGKGAAFGWHRFGISQLAAVIATPVLATRGVVPLSRIGTEAIVARLVHRLKTERALGRYQSVSETPGFARAMTGVIAELRSAGLQSNSVENVAPDLAPIIRQYERELAEGGFTDWSGTLELATSAIAGLDRHRLIGLPTLLLDVPTVTEAEFAFVSALAAASPATLATIPAADAATLNRFRIRLGFKVEDLDRETGEGEATSALARLQRHLFNEHDKPLEIQAGDEFEIFSAPGEVSQREACCWWSDPGPAGRETPKARRRHETRASGPFGALRVIVQVSP
jgi:ATP-dependent helicase/nuclease subunit B